MLARAALSLTFVASLATCGRCGEADGGGTAGGAASATSVVEASASSRIGSCDRISKMSICSEYAGGYLARDEAILTSTCAKFSGTFVYAECPNTSVLGACKLSTTEARKYYASGALAYDATRAKQDCDSLKGKWTAF
jgi:hypothetical protein